MSRQNRGPYRKYQRYDPNRIDPYEYKCDECGGPLGDTHAEMDLGIPYHSSSSVCNDCALKLANNKFISLKKKTPEETISDFDEL